jgi:hypothetical protein
MMLTTALRVMAGEGPLSTSLLRARKKDVDADPSLRLGQALRRHDGQNRHDGRKE